MVGYRDAPNKKICMIYKIMISLGFKVRLPSIDFLLSFRLSIWIHSKGGG